MATFKGLITIRQSIAGGQNFDGTDPTKARTLPSANSIVYGEETGSNGGKFDPAFIFSSDDLLDPFGQEISQKDYVIAEIAARLGAPTSWSLTRVDPDGKEVVIRKQAAAGETDYYLGGGDAGLVMPAGSYLKLITSGSSAVQHVHLSLIPWATLNHPRR